MDDYLLELFGMLGFPKNNVMSYVDQTGYSHMKKKVDMYTVKRGENIHSTKEFILENEMLSDVLRFNPNDRPASKDY